MTLLIPGVETEFLFQMPYLIFTAGLTTSLGLVLLDINTGVSLNLPGPRRLKLAGIILVGSSLLFYLQQFGLPSLASTLAESIILGIVVSVVTYMVVTR